MISRYSSSKEDFSIGEMVRHIRFGRMGRIISVKECWDGTVDLEIDNDLVGTWNSRDVRKVK